MRRIDNDLKIAVSLKQEELCRRQSSTGVSCSYDPRDPRDDGFGFRGSRTPFNNREAWRQQERMREAVQQQLQQRPAWQTLLVPAAGIGLLTVLFGECFLLHFFQHTVKPCASESHHQDLQRQGLQQHAFICLACNAETVELSTRSSPDI